MLPLIVGGVMAAASIAGNLSGNSAIRKTARGNYASQQAQQLQQLGIAQADLRDKAQEVNMNTGMQLTDLLYKATSATGQATAATTERNLVGTSAYRAQKNASMKAAIMEDSIIQQGESSMKGIQRALTDTKYKYDAGMLQAGAQYSNTMSKQKGTFQMIQEGGSAFMSGYSIGSTLGGAMGGTTATTTATDNTLYAGGADWGSTVHG